MPLRIVLLMENVTEIVDFATDRESKREKERNRLRRNVVRTRHILRILYVRR